MSLRFLVLLALVTPSTGCVASPTPDPAPRAGNVIFIHPDGTSLSGWNAHRIAHVGPDGLTAWDQLPGVGLYRSHFKDGLSPTSHGGATVHAWGVKVQADSFGTDGGEPLVARSGAKLPLLAEAAAEGLATGIVQTGHLAEPGTAVFLVSSPARSDTTGIAAKLLESGVDVLLGGGEILLLPEGMQGRHGAKGIRTDGRDLLAEARAAGYTVVYDRDELRAAARSAKKLIGIFAAGAMYRPHPEEELRRLAQSAYVEGVPTVAEMTAAALAVLERSNRRFALVVEEEGTDDFANANNASGVLEAYVRADAAIAVAREFVQRQPNTLLLTAADSDASGLQIIGLGATSPAGGPALVTPAATKLGNAIDGIDGSETQAFLSAPDRAGRQFWFGVTFATNNDLVGSVVARADGLNHDRLPLNFDNTEVYTLLYETLFGRSLPPAPMAR